jgi:hypothetical protein
MEYIYDSQKQKYKFDPSGKPLGKGGEGTIYPISGQPDLLVKIYNKKKKKYEEKLKFMVQNPPFTKGEDEKLKAAAWPIDLAFTQNGKFIGFFLTNVKQSVDITLLTTPNIDQRELDKQPWLYKFNRLSPNAYFYRLIVCRNLASVMNELHISGNYVIVDNKPENIRLLEDGCITVIDLDGIQVSSGAMVFPAESLTPEYCPAEYYSGEAVIQEPNRPILSKWDVFSFASITYKILAGGPAFTGTLKPKLRKESENRQEDLIRKGFFPTGRNRNKFSVLPAHHEVYNDLPYRLRKLFQRSFETTSRPCMREWLEALDSEFKRVKQEPEKYNLYLTYQKRREKRKSRQLKNTINKHSGVPAPGIIGQIKMVFPHALFLATVLFLLLPYLWPIGSQSYPFLSNLYILSSLQISNLVPYLENPEIANHWKSIFPVTACFALIWLVTAVPGDSTFWRKTDTYIKLSLLLLLPPVFGLFNWLYELLVMVPLGFAVYLAFDYSENGNTGKTLKAFFIGFYIYAGARFLVMIMRIFVTGNWLRGSLDAGLLALLMLLLVLEQTKKKPVQGRTGMFYWAKAVFPGLTFFFLLAFLLSFLNHETFAKPKTPEIKAVLLHASTFQPTLEQNDQELPLIEPGTLVTIDQTIVSKDPSWVYVSCAIGKGYVADKNLFILRDELRIKARNANIRKQPTTSGKIIMQVQKGEVLRYRGYDVSSGDLWLNVGCNNKIGFIRYDLLDN